jgi:hypothetical protein
MYPDEKMSSVRLQVEIPVYIGQEETITRDVCYSGVYFLTDQSFVVGDDLNFLLEFPYALPGKKNKLDCQGEVVRVEQRGKKLGIAVKINNSQYIN